MANEKPVVVITGFGPFGIHSKNASWEAVKLLPHMNIEEECDISLVIVEIPVAYDDVDQIVPQLWEKYKPIVIFIFISIVVDDFFQIVYFIMAIFQLMIHNGVSHIAKRVTLESCANRSGYCGIDVKECKLLNGVNVLGDKEHIKTGIDLDLIKCEAEQFSVNLDKSDNAHRYDCRFVLSDS